MKTPTISKHHTDIYLPDEIMLFGWRLINVVGACIGIWAIAALISGLANEGIITIIRSYVSAITGV